MTPQLFINYKLQSVAHLNWRTMSYKSINTFIDDLFAFVIKMPIMHRLACLRDDTIFFRLLVSTVQIPDRLHARERVRPVCAADSGHVGGEGEGDCRGGHGGGCRPHGATGHNGGDQ